MERLQQQLDFLKEIDKVKGILRATLVLNSERQENDAEHSWHMALTAMVLKDHFREEISLEKVLKMILIHDIVEIYAGDNPCFGEINPNKEQEERESANKIFSLLPEDQYNEFMDLWEEFEERKTPEARFANCCDRYQGFLQNIESDGHTWRLYNVKESQVMKRIAPVKEYMPEVFKNLVYPQIERYKQLGILKGDS